MGSSTSSTSNEPSTVEAPKETPEQLRSRLELSKMPTYVHPETFEQKLYRKFSEEPLIPIGCATTVYFLSSGIKSFYNRDTQRSQKMMRARVGAQFATVMIFIGYYGMNSFDLNFAPGYNGKEKKDEKSEEGK